MNYKRILIVDKSEISLNLLKHSVQQIGSDYQIVSAKNGFAALVQLFARRFDLLITAEHLHGVDGLELARLSRRISPGTHIVLLTKHDINRAQARARQQHLTLDGFLSKPFTFTQLSKVVKG
jgi:CheY-like chemotaxis protein